MDLKGSQTHAGLKLAFARKAQANRLYLFLAKLSDNEGRRDLARLFRDIAEGEALHAHGLLQHLRKAGDPLTGAPLETWEHFTQAAIEASKEEATKLFPEMAAKAREEGFAEIADWFDSLARAETAHADRFTRYKDNLETD